jgi:alkylation response protein AidB-like acyl-CoA dehydrogenase
LLRLSATDAQKAQHIPSIISGERRFAFAFAEQQSRFNLASVSTAARQRDGDYILTGRKIVVYGAPECQMLLVTARTAGDLNDRDGISLFLVPNDTDGLQVRAYTCLDGMSAAEITMKEVRVSHEDLVGELNQALPVIERVIDYANSAICGEAVGIMAALIEKCVDYSKSRHAFGKPIAEFQVIGHRLVDMQVSYEVASAIALKAAAALEMAATDAAKSVAACKFKVAQEAIFVGKAAVQLHGAIGTTDELDIGHYFKRLLAIQTLFGSADFHLQRYIQLGAGLAESHDGH